MRLTLNGFYLSFSAPELAVWVDDVPDPSRLGALRAEYGPDWFIYWRDGRLLAIPRSPDPARTIGQRTIMDSHAHDTLQLLVARVNDCLPDKFPKYEAFRRRPFSFLGHRDELVASTLDNWGSVHPLVRRFTIRPRFEFDPRILELRDGETRVALFLRVSTTWRTDAPLDELQAAGVNLSGLHVIRRIPVPGERSLVGRIAQVLDGTVVLSEAYGSLRSVPAVDVTLEGSRAAFSRCLETLLRFRFRDFEDRRRAQEARLFTGPAVHQLLEKMHGVLQKVSPIQLAPDLQCTVHDLVSPANTPGYTTVFRPNPVEYCYDVSKAKRSRYAWTGIEKYGPFSTDTFSAKTPRILVVCPDTAAGQVGQFVKKLRDGIQSLGSSRYATGFARTFHLVNPTFDTCSVALSGSSSAPAPLYRQAIQDFLASRTTRYDAALVVVLDQHADFADSENPYLWAKASLLMAGVPVQEARLSTITKQDSVLQYTLQNITVALYAKMGGVPWTVDHPLTVNDEIVLGLGSVELSGSRFEERQRYIGITTVFRGDGNYLLSHISAESSYENYAATLQESLAHVLRDIKTRNGWVAGDTIRIVVHSFKPLKNVEVAALTSRSVHEAGADQTVQFAFLTVTGEHAFRLLDLDQSGKGDGSARKGVYVPERGTTVQIGRFTRIVCTNGPELVKRPGAPLPSPLLVHLHQESDYMDQTYLAEQVLKFTSLSWRSTLPAREPVTIYYSSLIAGMLARLRAVPGWSPQVLNSSLRASKWFL